MAAIGSMGFYGMLIGGWASGSKYALLGGLRAVAQLVSYEVAFTLAIIGVVIQSGTLSLQGIVNAQHDYPYIVPQILGFGIFYLSALAECNRPPFDLAEADGEIVAGFHTEYGGMRFAMFANAEFVEAIVLAALGATLFLGGWRGPLPFEPFTSIPGPHLDDRQHVRDPVHVHLGARDGSATALRPPHEARLEGAPAARDTQPARHRRLGGAVLMEMR